MSISANPLVLRLCLPSTQVKLPHAAIHGSAPSDSHRARPQRRPHLLRSLASSAGDAWLRIPGRLPGRPPVAVPTLPGLVGIRATTPPPAQRCGSLRGSGDSPDPPRSIPGVARSDLPAVVAKGTPCPVSGRHFLESTRCPRFDESARLAVHQPSSRPNVPAYRGASQLRPARGVRPARSEIRAGTTADVLSFGHSYLGLVILSSNTDYLLIRESSAEQTRSKRFGVTPQEIQGPASATTVSQAAIAQRTANLRTLREAPSR